MPWPYNGVTPDQARECKRAYYAAISFVDAQIGHVLDAVERLGLQDRTIIVFWSDHGYHLGEHGLWFKQSCFEESGAGAADYLPARPEDGGPSESRLVEYIDLYPTLADVAGQASGEPGRRELAAPGKSGGRRGTGRLHPGAARVLSRPQRSYRAVAIYGVGLRPKGMELYDHDKDPQELHNLAGDAKHSDVVATMKGLLKRVHPAPVQGGKAEPRTREKFSN